MREKFVIKFDHKDNIVGYRWYNPEVKQIGIVQIAHGLSEHILRYDEFANFLVNNGFQVIGADHYHHGESAEDPKNVGIISDYDFIDAVIKSIKLVREEFSSEFTGIRCLFSHSMGSISTQEYIQRYQNDYDKVVLSGTDVGDFKYKMLKILSSITSKNNPEKCSKIINSLTFGNFQKKFPEKSKFNWLSKNEKNILNYEADPLCGAPVPDMAYHSIACSLNKTFKKSSIKKINKNLKIFIFSGAKDPVSNFGKSVNKLHKKYKAMGLNVSKKLYANLRHETLNENERFDVYNDVIKFLKD